MSLAPIAQRILAKFLPSRFYCEDALITTHAFPMSREFETAYARSVKATEGRDSHNRWRIHTALWAASNCAKLDGDFVECGVSYGMTASAIMQNLNWNKLDKTFYLFDSFDGLSPEQVSSEQLEQSKRSKQTGFYNCSVEKSMANFSEWPRTKVVAGWLPESLLDKGIKKIAFLHLDLNALKPEIESFRWLLPYLVPGAMVLLDDYGYAGGGEQFKGWNEAAKEFKLTILALPTGQGLIIPVMGTKE